MRVGLDIGSTTIKCVVLGEHDELLYSTYERHYSHILEKAQELLRRIDAEQLHGARAVGGDVVVQIVKITHMFPFPGLGVPLGFLCRHYNTPRTKCKAPIRRGRLHKHRRGAQKIFLPQSTGFSLQAAKILL